MADYRKILVLLDLTDASEQILAAGRNMAAHSARLGLARAATRVEAGNKKTEILRIAKEEAADLIVLGSRERHGLGILVNFTEDTVLHAAHCDVLAVRIR